MEKELSMKTCITGKKKDAQKVSRIPNESVTRTDPIKKESDITNQQKTVMEGSNTAIQSLPKEEMRFKVSLCLRNLRALNLFPEMKIKMSGQQEIGVIKIAQRSQ